MWNIEPFQYLWKSQPNAWNTKFVRNGKRRHMTQRQRYLCNGRSKWNGHNSEHQLFVNGAVLLFPELHSELQLADILAFWTGADSIPPTGFQHQLRLQFYSSVPDVRRLPSASTCAMIMWLPRNVGEPDAMWQLLCDAINMSAGFGKLWTCALKLLLFGDQRRSWVWVTTGSSF